MGRFCTQCGIWHEETGPRCIQHAADDNAIRLARRRRDGRNFRAWNATRIRVIQRDDHRCRDCGEPARVDDPLTVHKIAGGYHTTEDDAYLTMHRSCHGRLHGRKSHSEARSL